MLGARGEDFTGNVDVDPKGGCSLRSDASVVGGAAEVAASGARIAGLFGIRTQRPAARGRRGGKLPPGGEDALGCNAFFDPFDQRRQHIELIGRRATAAVPHIRHQEQPCERFGVCKPAIARD